MISILKSLLPPRYRSGEIPRSAAAICGICQIILSVVALVTRAIFWMQNRTQVDLHTASVLGGFDIPGSGIFILVEFWFNPLHVFIFYMLIEGMVRTLAAVASHQVIGTLPLYIVSGVHGLVDKVRYKRHVG